MKTHKDLTVLPLGLWRQVAAAMVIARHWLLPTTFLPVALAVAQRQAETIVGLVLMPGSRFKWHRVG